jgi:hypothetical protein
VFVPNVQSVVDMRTAALVRVTPHAVTSSARKLPSYVKEQQRKYDTISEEFNFNILKSGAYITYLQVQH